MVTNNLNKAYFLRENDPVFNGYVVKITGDSVVFQETRAGQAGQAVYAGSGEEDLHAGGLSRAAGPGNRNAENQFLEGHAGQARGWGEAKCESNN